MRPYKLKLISKRLVSGKCQIKFYVSSAEKPKYYGYLLAESGTTLKEVVKKIENRLKREEQKDSFPGHLYNLAMKSSSTDQIIIYNS